MNKELLASLLDDLPGMAYVCRNDPDWTMEFVSEGCFGLTGYHSEDLLANRTVPYAGLIHPDDRETVWNQIQSAIVAHATYRLAYRITTATGQEKWVWEQGSLARRSNGHGPLLEGIIIDITEQRKLEQILQKRTGLLQLQQVIAAAANESNNVPDSLRSVLALVCAYTGWPAGHACLAGDDSADVWHGPNPGPRTKHATPITAGTEVVGTLEFFEESTEPLTAHLEQVLRYVGTELGRIIERTRAENTLQQRERHYHALLDSINDNITLISADGTTLYESPSVEKLQGFKPEELVGKSALDNIHPDDLPKAAEMLQRGAAIPGFTASMECRVRHKDGTWRHCEIVGKNLLHDPAIGAILLSSRDITERQATNEALRRSEQKYRVLVEQSPDAIISVSENWKILFANSAASELTGYPLEELLRLSILDTYDPEERETAVLRWKELDASSTLRFERNLRRKDGSHIVAEVILRRIADNSYQGILRDVSARKRAEENLRLQGAALQAAANAIVIATTDGVIRWVNPAFTQLTGYQAEEVVGQHSRMLKSGQHPPEFYAQMWRTILAGQVWRGELVNRHKDGTLYHEDMTVTPVLDARGQVTHFVAIKQDITERTRMTKELLDSHQQLRQTLDQLRHAQEQVVQQERLRALGTMASGIAHDFNNSLTAILGFTELLLHRPGKLDDRESVRRYLDAINTSARDAANVVTRLRQFYRHREENELFAAIDLNHLVEETITLTQPKWKTQVEVRGLDIQVCTDLADVPAISGSAADLREALTNLIFNAVDAMPRGGTVTLRTRADGDAVCLEVTDTGLGMTEEVRRRCLEPFFSTKGDRGTGLGLSMVYGIVQRHGGTIDIQSRLGVGTTFCLRLPLRPAAATSSEPTETAPLPALRVLVVDDETSVRDIITELLTGDGHTVTAAADGREALEKLQAGTFDLVLLDRAMPGMNGDQVAAAVKKLRPTLPVIMLTGFGVLMQANQECPAGVDFVVPKPVTLEDLRAALARATAQS
jgi:PAS domain S-box-containing protein